MMNDELLRELEFLRENIKGISCSYFHTFLKRNLQRINKIESQKCEWSHWKGYDQKIDNSLHTMCIFYKHFILHISVQQGNNAYIY